MYIHSNLTNKLTQLPYIGLSCRLHRCRHGLTHLEVGWFQFHKKPVVFGKLVFLILLVFRSLTQTVMPCRWPRHTHTRSPISAKFYYDYGQFGTGAEVS